jgi:hypothetical protein
VQEPVQGAPDLALRPSMASLDKNPGRPVGGPRLSDRKRPRRVVGSTFKDVGEHEEWHHPTAGTSTGW